MFFEPAGDLFFRLCTRQAVNNWRVDCDAFAGESNCRHVCCGLNDNDNRQTELFCKFQVAIIVSRDTADRAGPIPKQHVISDPDWNLLVGRRIDRVGPGKHAGFFFGQIGTFELALARSSFAILAHRRPLFFGNNSIDEGMFRREHQESTAIKRIRSRSEDAKLVAGMAAGIIDAHYREIDFRALAPANPIALKQFDSLGPIKFVEFIDQALRIGRDTQHPLSHRSSNDREAANFALSVNDFFVGKNCS